MSEQELHVGFEIEAHVFDGVTDHGWDRLSESWCDTEAEAEAAIEDLKFLGGDWATGEYRIVPAIRSPHKDWGWTRHSRSSERFLLLDDQQQRREQREQWQRDRTYSRGR